MINTKLLNYCVKKLRRSVDDIFVYVKYGLNEYALSVLNLFHNKNHKW